MEAVLVAALNAVELVGECCATVYERFGGADEDGDARVDES
jgi:hypothetical protein